MIQYDLGRFEAHAAATTAQANAAKQNAGVR
jgi:hypothetical protein